MQDCWIKHLSERKYRKHNREIDIIYNQALFSYPLLLPGYDTLYWKGRDNDKIVYLILIVELRWVYLVSYIFDDDRHCINAREAFGRGEPMTAQTH